MVTRKEFLSKSAAAGSLIIGSSITGLNFLNSQVFANEDDFLSQGKAFEKTLKIIKSATRAPSGHNSQPWTVKIISESELAIGWDKSRSLPAVDPQNRELLLSIGAFCEALKISAKNEGLDSRIKITGNNPFAAEFARIRFSEAEKSSLYSEELQKRRTVKKGMINRNIEKADIQTISAGTGSGIHVINRGSAEASFIEEVVLESNIIQTGRDEAQKELSSWIRWSDRDVKKYSNGLSPAGMEIEGLGALYVKTFFNAETVMTKSFRDSTIDQIKKHLSSYGSWIIITSKKEDCSSLINTGGDFLKLSLNSFNKKISLHPMTQPLEEKGFEKNLRNRLGIDDKIQFILRCGYVNRFPDPVSKRMPLRRIVL